MPKSTQRVDLRYATIAQINAIVDQFNSDIADEKIEMIFFTNFGLVRGKIYEPKIDEQSFFSSLIKKSVDYRNEFLIEEEKANNISKVVNDSSFLCLKDVKITPYSAAGITHSIANFILFTDQIVGLSVGGNLTFD